MFYMSKNELFGPNWSHVDSSLYSVKISLRILDRPGSAFAFQSGTDKTVCSNIVIYGHNNQTISNTNLNHTINHLLFLSNYAQNLVKVGLVS